LLERPGQFINEGTRARVLISCTFIKNMKMELAGDTLQLRGLKELAATNADQIKAAVAAACSDGDGIHSIECDVSGVHFIDSHGVGALIALNRMCRARHGRLRLRDPSRPVELVLQLTRLGRVFEVINDTTLEGGDKPGQAFGKTGEVAQSGKASG
jgi:anti-anti-sigma factor